MVHVWQSRPSLTTSPLIASVIALLLTTDTPRASAARRCISFRAIFHPPSCTMLWN
uniref:Uncharacterized protein n=1 Tax=Anguilla anguilla TaxID=7936 RepID=A0A0E9TCV9_ANGAN